MFSLVCLSSWFDGRFASVLLDIDWCFGKVGGAFIAFAYFCCHWHLLTPTFFFYLRQHPPPAQDLLRVWPRLASTGPCETQHNPRKVICTLLGTQTGTYRLCLDTLSPSHTCVYCLCVKVRFEMDQCRE